LRIKICTENTFNIVINIISKQTDVFGVFYSIAFNKLKTQKASVSDLERKGVSSVENMCVRRECVHTGRLWFMLISVCMS